MCMISSPYRTMDNDNETVVGTYQKGGKGAKRQGWLKQEAPMCQDTEGDRVSMVHCTDS